MLAAQRDGTTAVWPLFYAGTMGLVQRWTALIALRNVMRYSRQHSPQSATRLVDAGWTPPAWVPRWSPTLREMADADLVVRRGSTARSPHKSTS